MNPDSDKFKFRPMVFTATCLASLLITALIAPMEAPGSYFIGYLFLFICGVGLVVFSGSIKKMRYYRAGIALLLLAPILPILILIIADYL